MVKRRDGEGGWREMRGVHRLESETKARKILYAVSNYNKIKCRMEKLFRKVFWAVREVVLFLQFSSLHLSLVRHCLSLLFKSHDSAFFTLVLLGRIINKNYKMPLGIICLEKIFKCLNKDDIDGGEMGEKKELARYEKATSEMKRTFFK
jgi:hypothetical protein